MSHLLLTVRDPERRGRASLRETLVGRVGPRLAEHGPRGLTLWVTDEAADVPSPSPFGWSGRAPCALIDLDGGELTPGAAVALLQQWGFEVDACTADQSVYREYGGNAHAAPRDWPDGTRSPGVAVISYLRRPRRLDHDAWIARWHGVMSPVSEAIQPRCRYVRSVVAGWLTPSPPPFEGVVVEVFPSAEHITDPWRFYGADGPVSLVANMARIVAAVQGFTDLWTVRTVVASEWILVSDG